MASKRVLKKNINNLTYQLVSECFTYRHFHPEKNSKELNEIIQDIVKSRNELITKINHAPSEQKELAPYFKSVSEEMQILVTKLDKIETL